MLCDFGEVDVSPARTQATYSELILGIGELSYIPQSFPRKPLKERVRTHAMSARFKPTVPRTVLIMDEASLPFLRRRCLYGCGCTAPTESSSVFRDPKQQADSAWSWVQAEFTNSISHRDITFGNKGKQKHRQIYGLILEAITS